jgi:hypothetical protein
MTIVIPLGRYSVYDNIELKYALRGFNTYFPHDRVILVGEKPDWVTNVDHIPFRDTLGRKEYSIMHKLLVACEEVKEPFLYAHDDHFLLAPLSAPMYYDGLLSENKKNHSTFYGQMRANTAKALPGGRFYNVHAPMMIDPLIFPDIMRLYDWKNHNYLIKSLYGNAVGGGEEIKDLKIDYACTEEKLLQLTAGRPFFSIGDQCINKAFRSFMDNLYEN